MFYNQLTVEKKAA